MFAPPRNPTIYVQIFIPKVDGVRRPGLREVIRSWGWRSPKECLVGREGSGGGGSLIRSSQLENEAPGEADK